MSSQNRIYLTLSPRMRKALELCAALDGSTPASYAAMLMSSALVQEIEKHPALLDRWTELEREALSKGSWDTLLIQENAEATTPREKLQGWLLAGSHPQQYEYGVDKEETYEGKPSAYLRSKADYVEGFGTLMQTFKADKYRSKRLKYAAMVKAEGIEDWAGLWMRVDGPQGQVLSFDNMQSRSIQGTEDWQRYEIVLDVPEESLSIAFGILLSGAGQAWISKIDFTEVGYDVATTSEERHDTPVNLDFTREK